MAGYVCRKVLEKLQSSTRTSKVDIVLCLMQLNGDDDGDRGREVWVNYSTEEACGIIQHTVNLMPWDKYVITLHHKLPVN